MGKNSKRCGGCGETKSITCFAKASGRYDGVQGHCKLCTKSYRVRNNERLRRKNIEYKIANKDKIKLKRPQYRAKNVDLIKKQTKVQKLRWRYKISYETYQLMLGMQDGCCAICNEQHRFDKPLHVDHDHNTGAVRGLLCRRCNQGIGFLRDDSETLQTATNYLKDYER